MLSKKWISVLCGSVLGLAACSSDSGASAPIDPSTGEPIAGNPSDGSGSDTAPQPGVQPGAGQGAASSPEAMKAGVWAVSDETVNAIAIVGSTGSAADIDTKDLYTKWKAQHYRTLADESSYYPGSAEVFKEVFGSYSASEVGRVAWEAQSTGYYKDRCSYETSTDSQMKNRACTVSEGIGYGMLIALFQKDWDTYNAIWNYNKGFRAYYNYALMPWITYSFSYDKIDGSSATDADLDIATSLILASKMTGEGAYLDDAKKIINDIWEKEINKDLYLIYSGDTKMWTGHKNGIAYNLSYFSPVALKLFAEVDPSHEWKKVLDAMYTYMHNVQAAGTGVFPDWSDSEGYAFNPPNNSATKTYFTFNKESVRIPFRIAWDYAWYQDERAKDVLKTLNKFAIWKSNGDPSSVALAVNYSWDPKKADITSNTAIPGGWMGGWCVTGMGVNEKWFNSCKNALNTYKYNTTSKSYFHNTLQLMYTQLVNGKFVKP